MSLKKNISLLTKKHYISLLIVFIIAVALNFYRLEKYVMRPGNAYNVENFIKVTKSLLTIT